MYYVYIIECKGGILYTGITTDLKRRFQEHISGLGAAFTRIHKPLQLLYSEQYPDRSSASKREAEIKKMPRDKKRKLIDKTI